MAGTSMTAPKFHDQPPVSTTMTEYDRTHMTTYLRLLDAASEGAPWEEVARLVLGLDPAQAPDRVRRIHDTHLARARWLTEQGYRDLLRASR
jgi:hypothetical protein